MVYSGGLEFGDVVSRPAKREVIDRESLCVLPVRRVFAPVDRLESPRHLCTNDRIETSGDERLKMIRVESAARVVD